MQLDGLGVRRVQGSARCCRAGAGLREMLTGYVGSCPLPALMRLPCPAPGPHHGSPQLRSRLPA